MKRPDVAVHATPSTRVTVTVGPEAAELAAWDALVSAHPGADVTQLSGWGRLRRLAGYSPLYVLAHDQEQIVGGAQVLIRRVPVLGLIGYAPYGPLVFGRAKDQEEICTLLADTLRDLVRDRLRVLFVQPSMGGEQTSRALTARGFRSSDAGISPSVSLRVNLDVDAAELRRNLPKRMRKRTNQWETSGVTVRVGDAGDLPTLAELIRATGEHHGFHGFDLDYLTTMYRELDHPSGHVVLFVGEFEGRPVAIQLCTGSGGVLTARMTGFDRSSPGAHLRVPAATVWAAMQWGRENGYHEFDFGGLEEQSAAVLEAGGPQATWRASISSRPTSAAGWCAIRRRSSSSPRHWCGAPMTWRAGRQLDRLCWEPRDAWPAGGFPHRRRADPAS